MIDAPITMISCVSLFDKQDCSSDIKVLFFYLSCLNYQPVFPTLSDPLPFSILSSALCIIKADHFPLEELHAA